MTDEARDMKIAEVVKKACSDAAFLSFLLGGVGNTVLYSIDHINLKKIIKSVDKGEK